MAFGIQALSTNVDRSSPHTWEGREGERGRGREGERERGREGERERGREGESVSHHTALHSTTQHHTGGVSPHLSGANGRVEEGK